MYRRTRAQLREHSGRRSVEDISINFTAGALRFFFLPGLPPALEKVSKRNSMMNRRGNRIDNYCDPSRYGRILSERLALKEANIKVVLVYFGEPSIVSGMNTMEKVLASFSFRLATKETREMLLAFSILQRTRFPLLPFFFPLPLPCIPLSSFEMRKLLNTKNQAASPVKGNALCILLGWNGPADPMIRRISNETRFYSLHTGRNWQHPCLLGFRTIQRA